MSSWPAEDILNEDQLFYRVHRMWVRKGEVIPTAFQNRNAGMSTDWDKYSTPGETRVRARIPQDNGVVALLVGNVRQVPNQAVVHAPLLENRAHAEVRGEKDEEARVLLGRLAVWRIQLSAP